MKTRILALAVLSMAGWTLAASQADALHFGWRHFNRHYSVIMCRPYNAFTPICFGNMVCDGCCPSPFCGSGGAPSHSPSILDGCHNGICMAGDHGHVISAAPAAPVHAPMPNAGQYQRPAPFTPPVPMPVPMPMPNGAGFAPPPPAGSPVYNQTWNPQFMYGVQPAGYHPGYYPAYPMNYHPTPNYGMVPPMQAPAYWYNGR